MPAGANKKWMLRLMMAFADTSMRESGKRLPATPANTMVVIPSLNEQASIPDVISRLHAVGLNRIRVVDNGSRDHTAEVARRCEAEVINEPRRGYGQACWTGCQNLRADV